MLIFTFIHVSSTNVKQKKFFCHSHSCGGGTTNADSSAPSGPVHGSSSVCPVHGPSSVYPDPSSPPSPTRPVSWTHCRPADPADRSAAVSRLQALGRFHNVTPAGCRGGRVTGPRPTPRRRQVSKIWLVCGLGRNDRTVQGRGDLATVVIQGR